MPYNQTVRGPLPAVGGSPSRGVKLADSSLHEGRMSRNSTSSTPVNIPLIHEEEATQALTMSDLLDVEAEGGATEVTNMLTASDLLDVRSAGPNPANDPFMQLSDPDAPATATTPLNMRDLLEVRRADAESRVQPTPTPKRRTLEYGAARPLRVPEDSRPVETASPRVRAAAMRPAPATGDATSMERPAPVVPSTPQPPAPVGPAAPTLELPLRPDSEHPPRLIPRNPPRWRSGTFWLLLALLVCGLGAWLRLDPRAEERLAPARAEVSQLLDRARQTRVARGARAQVRQWHGLATERWPAYQRAQTWLADVWPVQFAPDASPSSEGALPAEVAQTARPS